ncbi:hypothetical protein CAPTEDRAFT_229258 [Capitella teleta]|uniref:Uncharacterized protein n=1 Tax=Capitella teleta TaxID=283909 RepID=R7U4I2_CAPTE|nr:hypothetical protein CAPTEDRAFT_229258 [Capitella teleta]|eukprot:ELT98596.1 hypothetical protein CAPTEDRAFT_229258 [Capitella teleta]
MSKIKQITSPYYSFILVITASKFGAEMKAPTNAMYVDKQCYEPNGMQSQYKSSYGVGLDGVTSNILEDLHCWRLNQHHVENVDGDLVPPLGCAFNPGTSEILSPTLRLITLLKFLRFMCSFYSKDHPRLLATVDECGDFLAHKNMAWDLCWLPGGTNILTASGDQTIALWDITTEAKISQYHGHTSSVRTVNVCRDQPAVFATGSIDGNIFLWDRRTKCRTETCCRVGEVRSAHASKANTEVKRMRHRQPQLDNRESVTAVLFQDSNTLLSSGSRDGCIKAWDTRKLTSLAKSAANPVHVFPYCGPQGRARGFSSLALDSSRTRLYANCVDNHVYVHDCVAFTPKPVAVFGGHKVSSFFVKLSLSPNDDYLLSGSSDNQAYIWNTQSPQSSPILLQGHTSEVPAVAWSSSDLGRIATTSDDCSLMVWHLQRENHQNDINPVLGPIVGNASRMRKEVGTSASPIHGMNMRPRTPRKGNTVPPSPAKISSDTRQTLISMQGLPCSVGTKPCSVASQSTIVKWLGRSPRVVPVTPRRLVITPKKTQECARQTAEARGVKRKLDSGFDSEIPANPKSNRGTPLRPLDHQMLNSPKSAKKTLFDEDDKTPVKKVRGGTEKFQSPTANLPSYVLNPEPRTPQGQLTPRSLGPNWLTQLTRQKKQDSCCADEPTTPVAKTPISTKKKECTPRTPKNTPKSLKKYVSILQYFSPKE